MKLYFENTSRLSSRLYHRSLSRIRDFDLSRSEEIGLHCGTKQQADSFSGIWLYVVNINPSAKFAKMKYDTTSTYGSLEFLNNLQDSGLITRPEYTQLLQKLRNVSSSPNKQIEYSKIYRDFLLSKHFDGFIYPNEIEGKGNSYCIINNDAIDLFKEMAEYISDACKKETGVPFEVYDRQFNGCSLKPEKFLGRYSFHNDISSFYFSGYDSKDNLFNFTYYN